MYTLLLTFLIVFSNVNTADLEADKVTGKWYLNIHESLKEANYKEGSRYFELKDLVLTVSTDAEEASFSGMNHPFFEQEFEGELKTNKYVLMPKKSLAEKMYDKATGNDKFNYTKQKVLITIRKDKLIAKVRPDKGEKELELIFSREENPTPKKEFIVKYDTDYISEEAIDGVYWELKFLDNGTAKLKKGDIEEVLPVTTAWSKKVFLGEGEYLVKSFSKALNVYSKENDEMYAMFPKN